MADTLVKKPKLIVGTQSQVKAEMGDNDIGFATDIEFYNKAEIDEQYTSIITYVGDKDREIKSDITQLDTNIRTVGDWVNAKDESGNRAVLETEAQDAYRAINELNAKIGEGGGGASLPILMAMWSDHVINDMSWLRADTFSWQSGDVYKAAYEHLADDIATMYAWSTGSYVFYTLTDTPAVGDDVYFVSENYGTSKVLSVSNDTITFEHHRTGETTTATRNPSSDTNALAYGLNESTDTIGDITITYYLAQDGHKICLPDQESNVVALYEKTGAADYYLLDTTNKQFKLPRTKKPETNFIPDFANQQTVSMPFTAPKDGWFIAHAQNVSTIVSVNGVSVAQGNWQSGQWSGNLNCQIIVKKNDVVTGASGTMRFIPFVEADYNNKDENKHLYFYVGNFEQTAIEQTAGLNAELFNGKADRNLLNTTNNVDIVVESQLPTSANGYTWYRKYKSGWVEQGGYLSNLTTTAAYVTLPVVMADANYIVTTGQHVENAVSQYIYIREKPTTTQITLKANNGTVNKSYWQVCGMAA